MTTSINKIMKNRKNKKGFSLIELIIVLVIMAILAAALVPTLVGYIRQTRESNAKNEAAACVTAAQTISSSAFADPDGVYHNNGDGDDIDISFAATSTWTGDLVSVIAYLAEVDGTISGVAINEDGLVTALNYLAGNGEYVTYTSTAGYTVTDPPAGS